MSGSIGDAYSRPALVCQPRVYVPDSSGLLDWGHALISEKLGRVPVLDFYFFFISDLTISTSFLTSVSSVFFPSGAEILKVIDEASSSKSDPTSL
jgi:hypothetical protein